MILNDINSKTYEKILALFKRYNRVGLEQCTGSGKGCIGVKWIEDNPNKKFFVLSSNNTSLFTYKKNLNKATNVEYMLYSTLYKRNSSEIIDIVSGFDCVILDEIHRTGAELWQRGVNDLLFATERQGKKVLGLSATPIRYLDEARNMFTELKFEVIKGLTYQDMVDKGLSLGVEYHSVYFGVTCDDVLKNVNLKHLKKTEKTTLMNELNKTIELNDSVDVPNLLRKVFINGKCQKILCFFEDVESAIKSNTLVDSVLGEVSTTYTITGETPEKERERIIDVINYSTEGIHIIKCVNILNEGLHIEGLTGSMFFRSTCSPNLYLQQLGRTTYATTSIKPVIFDFVSNYQGIKGYLASLSDFCIGNQLKYSLSTDDKHGVLDAVSIIVDDVPLSDILIKIEKLSKNSEIFTEEEKELLRVFYPNVKEGCFVLFPGRDITFLRKQVREIFNIRGKDITLSKKILDGIEKYCPYQGVSYLKNLKLTPEKYRRYVEIARDKGVLRSDNYNNEIRNKLTAGVLEYGVADAYKNVPEIHPVVACWYLSKMGYKINRKYLDFKNDGWWVSNE